MSFVENGRPNPATKEEILDQMIADARDYWGENLNDGQEAVIRQFYEPVAERMADLQEDIGLVLDSSQIEYAEGRALSLLTALIGVRRDPGAKATGQVTFSRGSDATTGYTIPKGTVVQTKSSDPMAFETTESAILESGTQSVTAPIKALERGPQGNVGANAITVMSDSPPGIESVTNNSDTTGGQARESDDELRQRAMDELAEGSRTSTPALVSAVSKVEGVTSTKIFVNDSSTDNTDSGGLPDHSFEVVVSGGSDTEIGQTILDTKAAGDTDYGGAYGSAVTVDATLPNGQTQQVTFSRPQEVKIYVEADVTRTDQFPDKDTLRDAIVNYIGGIRSSGQETNGDLGTGEDVLFGEVEYAIRSVDGVYDVSNLYVDTSSPPSGTSNIAISNSEVSVADATDGSLSFTLSSK